ncbi:DUF1349 domain-containing protein [Sporolactobacillus shoreicorticis]|uniref:DUF1349 domain-containing protein n=1 Tax=Sporolactobacillus shoreicorticis TaxID=1923877 RepID=A0ABW5S1Z7_9BACL|nr:DUF1349 domain-containing protein [Sporolactobacillus shoreicorticis]MCO7125421.1 DUF1349 domain-containing protein [Sporolactobacillus shoreicorticis]
MKRTSVNWREGSWSNEPEHVTIERGILTVKARQGSDYWAHTFYNFRHQDGHALLKEWYPSEAIEVSFSLNTFNNLYDQAGVMIWLNDHQWVKSGIEMNDGVPHLGAVVTNKNSDWSLAPVPDWKNKGVVTVRASFFNHALILRARAGEEEWRTVRVCPFDTDKKIYAGPFLCAPKSSDFVVHFTNWFRTAPDEDLHRQPQ